ncbi:HAD-IIB family hydrolase [Ferrimonas sediminicola]|uniref:HAD-IIB family hydrolase n=2 Tax=Ferrimonas sediminicola TaxID=2569538 RepID=A0A4U1BA88_9GAMM|nr:HAD-IIB family hydrolase [Ferrimonas sediminicola]TKB47733.1 HAD-IIB family hydrolase [Ferrimonas sediminicola]
MAPTPKLLVVTDLDGTLLDHHSYSFQPAEPALARLRRLGIPLILNTSKTAAELAPLRRELGTDAPYVVENGAALYWPPPFDALSESDANTDKHNLGATPGAILGHRMQALGASRAQILAALAEIRRDTGLKLEGFSDWNADTLMAHTGLERRAAEQALDRQFSEPLWWQGSEAQLARLQQAAEAYGLRLLMGGRFLHLVGQSDKGRCIEPLRRAYTRQWGLADGAQPKVIALGDGDNDLAMLEAADHPVLVRSPVNPLPELSDACRTRAMVTEGYGPLGWNEAVHRLLDRYRLP